MFSSEFSGLKSCFLKRLCSKSCFLKRLCSQGRAGAEDADHAPARVPGDLFQRSSLAEGGLQVGSLAHVSLSACVKWLTPFGFLW
jgi:hypothetical protein